MKEEMDYIYRIELTCGHSIEIQFNKRMKFNENDDIQCLECDDFHLVQDYVCINDFSSFTLLMNRKSFV